MSAHSRKEELLSFLHRCADYDDRATFANLRCVLRKNLKQRAWPLLARFGGIENEFMEYDHSAKVVQTIAGLYASHPNETQESDFGSACKKLMSDDEKRDMNGREAFKKVGPVARRFQHLLSSERDEICDRVVRFALRMKTQGIPVNYSELYDGLICWDDKRKNKWAGSFWSAAKLEEAVL